MTDLFIEEELCLQRHWLTWELGGWAAFLRGGDIYVDHLHHNAGLTRRLRMASNGTETLPLHAGPQRRFSKYQNPTSHFEPHLHQQPLTWHKGKERKGP